jgi:hypothetical protein
LQQIIGCIAGITPIALTPRQSSSKAVWLTSSIVGDVRLILRSRQTGALTLLVRAATLLIEDMRAGSSRGPHLFALLIPADIIE